MSTTTITVTTTTINTTISIHMPQKRELEFPDYTCNKIARIQLNTNKNIDKNIEISIARNKILRKNEIIHYIYSNLSPIFKKKFLENIIDNEMENIFSQENNVNIN